MVLIGDHPGGVRRISLSRPAARNAIDAEMCRALQAAFEAASRDKAVRAVILAADGPHFSVGGDLGFFGTLDRPGLLAFHREALKVVRLLATFPKPIVAAVQGACAGGGVGFVLCCDHVIAAKGANFSVPFLKIGLTPDMGIGFLLRDRLGGGSARRIILEGRPVDAAEASAIGLIDALADDEVALAAESLGTAARLAALPPNAVAQTKRLMRCAGSDFERFLDEELKAGEACLGSEEYEEGLRAFAEKRPPRF